MNAPYLPNVATLEQAQAWLAHETGQQWPLARLIEEMVLPYVWIDYTSDTPPEIFAGRLEGYLAPMLFAGDTQRLAAGADDVVITMTEAADGRLMRLAGMRCPLSELRFKADDLRESARVANGESTDTESPEATSPPKGRQRWQEEEILRALKELGYEPKRLPRPTAGTPGPKKQARDLFPQLSEKVFDKAWERLRRYGDIADA